MLKRTIRQSHLYLAIVIHKNIFHKNKKMLQVSISTILVWGSLYSFVSINGLKAIFNGSTWFIWFNWFAHLFLSSDFWRAKVIISMYIAQGAEREARVAVPCGNDPICVPIKLCICNYTLHMTTFIYIFSYFNIICKKTRQIWEISMLILSNIANNTFPSLQYTKTNKYRPVLTLLWNTVTHHLKFMW